MTVETPWRSRRSTGRRSTSTVTSSSRSNSPSTSSTAPVCNLFESLSASPSPPSPTPSPTPRTLPRAGLVNFRREGDSLRWAPRVTKNTSGIAARVHDFADAFELEEFSSRALPPLLPRLDVLPTERFSVEEEIDISVSPMQKPEVVKDVTVKKAVVLASDIGRPSFFSLLAHTNKYQRAKARLQAEESYRSLRQIQIGETTQSTGTSNTRRPPRKNRRNGKSATSLFRRLWESLDRRGKQRRKREEVEEALDELNSPSMEETPFDYDRVKHSTEEQRKSLPEVLSRTQSDSMQRIRFERPKGIMFGRSRLSGLGDASSRRVVSSMSGRRERRKMRLGRDLGPASDDQYVTFITSVG